MSAYDGLARDEFPPRLFQCQSCGGEVPDGGDCTGCGRGGWGIRSPRFSSTLSTDTRVRTGTRDASGVLHQAGWRDVVTGQETAL